MKTGKKIQRKLEARLQGHEKLLAAVRAKSGKPVPEGAFRMPGSRKKC